MATTTIYRWRQWLEHPVAIAPLITFRILFGGLMAVGALRFMAKGWIEKLYGEPVFFFKYYGFEWVRVFDVPGMYVLYAAIALSAACIMVGLFYRVASVVFFLTFTYAELTDATNYLNHYYLVCLLALLLIFLPAHRCFSLDVWRRPQWRATHVPAWTIKLLMLQLGIVYFCAGYAKLNPDWLLRAMPLAAWLPAKADLPVLGAFLQHAWMPFAFSWAGAFYDLTIPFFLLNRHTRPFAYGAVIAFHALTKLLFNIGLFPFIMIFNTLIFFPAAHHERWLRYLGYRPGAKASRKHHYPVAAKRLLTLLLAGYLLLQCALPFRYLLYPGQAMWTEEGYRFAWRVMLVEKAGHAVFTVHDPASGRSSEVDNSAFLTPFQEKQMAIQPDLMLQYAHFLAAEYRRRYGVESPVVTVDSWVALNGRSSRRLIDPNINLAVQRDGLAPKDWILTYAEKDNTL